MSRVQVRPYEMWNHLQDDLRAEVMGATRDRPKSAQVKPAGDDPMAKLRARRDALEIDPGKAEQFSPDLKALYEAHKPAKGGMNPYDLLNLYQTHAAQTVADTAGVGRSALWLSKDEATQLPEAFQGAYAKTRAAKQRSVDADAALQSPFPKKGVVDPRAFFDHLKLGQAEAANQLIRTSRMTQRLEAVHAEIKAAGGTLEVGGMTLVDVEGPGFPKIDGRSLYGHGGESRFVVRDGHTALVVSWEDAFRAEGPGKTVLARYDLRAAHVDPENISYYQPPGTGLMDGLDLTPEVLAGSKPKRRGEPRGRALLERFANVDLAGIALAARAVTAAQGGDVARIDAIAEAGQAAVAKIAKKAIPQMAKKADMLGLYRGVADAVKAAPGQKMTLGDMDCFLSIADRFVKTKEDDDGNEQEYTLVDGRGPLLIVDNSFGGLGHAIPLAALDRGELEVHISHETSKRGLLHIGKGGKARCIPDLVSFQRVLQDLTEFLPAGIED